MCAVIWVIIAFKIIIANCKVEESIWEMKNEKREKKRSHLVIRLCKEKERRETSQNIMLHAFRVYSRNIILHCNTHTHTSFRFVIKRQTLQVAHCEWCNYIIRSEHAVRRAVVQRESLSSLSSRSFYFFFRFPPLSSRLSVGWVS